MNQPFKPITLGSSLRSLESGHLVLTETVHPPALHLPPHRHERANIVVVLGGFFCENSNQKNFDCGPASLLIKPAGVLHSDLYGKAGAKCLIIEFKPELLQGLESPFHFEQIEQFMGGSLWGLATRIYHEFHILDHASIFAIEGLALEILAEGIRRTFEKTQNDRPIWLREAKNFIDMNFAQPLKLSHISEVVGVHPSHLARTFRLHHDCTVGEYLRRSRIDYAIKQLTYSEKTILEIALESGFFDQSHFTNAFKSHVGMTPAQFIRMIKRK